MFISFNSAAVECIIAPTNNSTVQQNNFNSSDPQRLFTNRLIYAIETISFADAAHSPVTTVNDVLHANVFREAYLSLYTTYPMQGGKQKSDSGLYIDKIPLSVMRRVGNNDNGTIDTAMSTVQQQPFLLRPCYIDWSKSYVWIANNVALTAAQSAVFIVHYLDEGQLTMKI